MDDGNKGNFWRKYFGWMTIMPTWAWFMIVILAGISFWLYPLLMDVTYNGNYEKEGQFGDMFGALNAFISGLAFIGFLVALQLQRKELKLQREEMERSRVESEKQTAIYEDQNQLLKTQLEEQVYLNTGNRLADMFYNKMAILQQQHDNVAFIMEPIRRETEIKTGIAAWRQIREETKFGIVCSQGFSPDENYLECIENNLYSYMTIHVWFMSFINIINDIILLKDAGRQPQSAAHTRTLESSLSGVDKEFICFFLHLHQEESMKNIKDYIEEQKMLDCDKYNLCRHFCKYELNKTFIEKLREEMPL